MCPFVNKYVPRLTHWTLCWIKWQTLLCIPSWEANGCKLYYSAAETHFPINLLYKVQCFSLRHILTLQQIVHRRFLSLPSIHGVKKQISFRSFSHCEVTVELEKKKIWQGDQLLQKRIRFTHIFTELSSGMLSHVPPCHANTLHSFVLYHCVLKQMHVVSL